MAQLNEIKDWFETGLKSKEGYTHMLVVCDTFNYEDYPVYVKPSEDVKKVEEKYSKDMQRVMEVYSLTASLDEQLSKKRNFKY